MIKLTRLDGELLVVNAELIESVGCGSETLISLTSGRKLMVRESPEEVIRLAVDYHARTKAAASAGITAGSTSGG
jgi:flagellar protein FlbD